MKVTLAVLLLMSVVFNSSAGTPTAKEREIVSLERKIADFKRVSQLSAYELKGMVKSYSDNWERTTNQKLRDKLKRKQGVMGNVDKIANSSDYELCKIEIMEIDSYCHWDGVGAITLADGGVILLCQKIIAYNAEIEKLEAKLTKIKDLPEKVLQPKTEQIGDFPKESEHTAMDKEPVKRQPVVRKIFVLNDGRSLKAISVIESGDSFMIKTDAGVSENIKKGDVKTVQVTKP
jgi:hypothetical protein